METTTEDLFSTVDSGEIIVDSSSTTTVTPATVTPLLPEDNPVTNPGFENDVVPLGFNFLSLVSGWENIGSPLTIKPIVGVHVKELPEGTQMALLPGGARLAQDVSGVILREHHLYTVWLRAAARLDSSGATTLTVALARSSGQVLASTVVTSAALLLNKGVFATTAVRLEVPTGAFYAGDTPRILLHAGASSYMVLVDHVVLSEQACTSTLCPLVMGGPAVTTTSPSTTTTTTSTTT